MNTYNEPKEIKAEFTNDDIKNTNTKTKADLIANKARHLDALTRRNQNTKHTNYSIFQLLLDPFTFDNAYSNISKNKGSFTSGVDSTTIQSYSRSDSIKIVELLKAGKYIPKPVRRKHIPKPGKKTLRPLGIPTFRDRVVQEALRGILEAIYEPMFCEFYGSNPRVENFGFRPGLGCWKAIEHFSIYGQRCTHVIEGDIKGAYNNVNHKKLISLLKRRIQDKKILKLIDSFLKAGIMEEGNYVHSLIGTPQGGIVSPILFNIYMFEFDRFIAEKIINNYSTEGGKSKITSNRTSEYQSLLRKRKLVRDKLKRIKDEIPKNLSSKERNNIYKSDPLYNKSVKEIKEMTQQLFRTPSKQQTISFVYTRYADDWVLAIAGDKSFAGKIKNDISEWLRSELFLELAEDKTKITNIRKTFINFLGYSITLRSNIQFTKITKVWTGTERQLRRTTSSKFFVKPDKERVLSKLRTLGITKGDNYYPIGKRPWAQLDEFQIVQKYKSMFEGLYNHYRGCDSLVPLNRLDYIYRYSCAKTIAVRKRKTMPQIFNMYGPELKIKKTIKGKSGQSHDRIVSYGSLKELREKTFHRDPGLPLYHDPFKIRTFWRTTFKLYSICCICSSDTNIEMHHVRSIKSIKLSKKNKRSFSLILKQLNRLQIPVCHSCHVNITNGKYSGMKLTELFSQSLAAL